MDTTISASRKRVKANVSSRMTDEALAAVLQAEKAVRPNEFSYSKANTAELNSQSFLNLSSGRAISQMKKWL